MTQLTLMDAVDGLQQGMDWREARNDRATERAELERVRTTRDAAGKAFNAALDGERTRWVDAQKAQGIDATPDAFKPDQGHYFNAAQAATMEFAKAGDWRGFMDQQVKLAPLRTQARATALQDFKLDGDMPRLVRRFYETVPDGGTITKAEMVDGTGPDGRAAAPMVRLHMADGRVVMKPQDELLQRISQAIQDPAKAAERDADLALFTAKNAVETAGKVKVEGVKGDEVRKTEGVKAGYEREKVGLQTAGSLAVAQERSRGDLAVAGLRNAGELAAVNARNAGDVRLQGLRSDSDIELAMVKDQLEQQGGAKRGKRLSAGELQRLVTGSGIGKVDPVSGATEGNEDSNRVALRAQQLLDAQPDMSELEAVNRAINDYRREQEAQRPKRSPGLMDSIGGLFTRKAPIPAASKAAGTSSDGWTITREPDTPQSAGRQAGGGPDYSHLWKGNSSPQQPSSAASAPAPASRPGLSLATPGRAGAAPDFRDVLR